MEIKKTKVGMRDSSVRHDGDLVMRRYSPVFDYAVYYQGFVSSGPDLGACIGRCYEAANSN